MKELQNWHRSGTPGFNKATILLVGYEAFRGLVTYHKKKNVTLNPDQVENVKKKVEETLLNPGADIVICDEGHIIKNSKSGISMAVSLIKTKRRIILTGTPIQNNLRECKLILSTIIKKTPIVFYLQFICKIDFSAKSVVIN